MLKVMLITTIQLEANWIDKDENAVDMFYNESLPEKVVKNGTVLSNSCVSGKYIEFSTNTCRLRNVSKTVREKYLAQFAELAKLNLDSNARRHEFFYD